VGFRSVRRSALVVLAVVLLYAVAVVEVFGRWEVWLPVAAPLGTLVVGFVSQSLTRYVTTGRELRQTRQTLLRYMPPAVVDHIMARGGPDKLKGERGVITVMFSDIRNFTKMSEMRTPSQVLDILNQYLDAMTEIVFAHHGVVDKFIGDGMLCYWGAFGDTESHARLAVTASSQMLAKLAQLNEVFSPVASEAAAPEPSAGGLAAAGAGPRAETGQAASGRQRKKRREEGAGLAPNLHRPGCLEELTPGRSYHGRRL
jgi:adenylate cyclase